jgi:hypothetical protein
VSQPPASSSPKAFDEQFRGYAWDYFELHSDHRLGAFHFYILLCSALIGGFAITAKEGQIQPWSSVFGLLLVFFSFVFWKMDNRTDQLVRVAENAIKFLDAQHGLPDEGELPHPLCLFAREQAESDALPGSFVLTGHFTYAQCFRWVFGMFSLVGIAIAVVALRLWT